MNIPYRYNDESSKSITSLFGGLDRRRKGNLGSFRDMKNMSGDEYKSIVTRGNRGKLAIEGTDVSAMVTTDVLIKGKIVENAFILDTDDCLMAYYKEKDKLKESFLLSTTGFTTTNNTVIASGGYMYFFPDKKYINLMNTSDFGSLEKKLNVGCGVVDSFWYEAAFEKCDAAGNLKSDGSYTKLTKNKYYYFNTTGKGDKLSSPSITREFKAGDVVEIKGTEKNNGFYRIAYIPENETYFVLDRGEAEIVNSGTVTVSRNIPDMDYVIASGNRLWGCRYGVNDEGEPINEIYASALGDPKNWYKFQGISTDSYTASIGVDGIFTGACEYQGCPMFFKEDAVIRVYGDAPSNYNVTTVNVRGVEKGSYKSIVNVSNNLIYKSHSGFVAYNSGNPVNIDSALGKIQYRNAVAGTLMGKYYVSAVLESGETELLVFDLENNVWHKEDDLRVISFSRCGGELYMLSDDGNVLSVCGSGDDYESGIEWSFETGELGVESHARKALLTAEARLEMPFDGQFFVDIEYDDCGEWQRISSHTGQSGRMCLRIKPRRCHTFKLRFSGNGEFALYSLAVKETECSAFRGIK